MATSLAANEKTKDRFFRKLRTSAAGSVLKFSMISDFYHSSFLIVWTLIYQRRAEKYDQFVFLKKTLTF